MKLPQVIFVTGKGGTGKSTVAATLARALAGQGPVTLIELDRRGADAAEGLAATVPRGRPGRHPLEVRALTAQGELTAFIERIVPVKAIARRMLRSRTFGFVSTALPGLEAFLILERIRLLANEAEPGRHLVIDGPATGGALEMLKVPAGVQRLAPVGTLHRLAAEVEKFMLTANRFGVLLTSRPEDFALREASAARTALDELGLSCVGEVLNMAENALFTTNEIALLGALPEHRQLAEVRREAADATTGAKRRLRQAGVRFVTLPLLHCATLGDPELETLAQLLGDGWPAS